MPGTSFRLRIAVAVSPALLGGALRRSLADESVEWIDLDASHEDARSASNAAPGGRPAGGLRFDLALVSAGREREVSAIRLLRLCGDHGPFEACQARRSADAAVVDVHDVDDIRRAIDDWGEGRGQLEHEAGAPGGPGPQCQGPLLLCHQPTRDEEP